MKELKIYEYQIEQLEETLRKFCLLIDTNENTSLLRDINVAEKTLRNIKTEHPDKFVPRD